MNNKGPKIVFCGTPIAILHQSLIVYLFLLTLQDNHTVYERMSTD